MKNYNFSNLVEMLKESYLRYPRRTALIFGIKRITYEELFTQVKKLAGSLSQLGVKELDKVCIWLPNMPEFIYSFFAILMVKAIVCPINTMFKREEARFIIEDSTAKVLITSVDKLESAENILSRLDSLKYIICVPSPKHNGNILDFYTLVNMNEPVAQDTNITRNDIAEIIYTSGTTGRPKGAVLIHKNLVSNVKDCIKAIRVNQALSTCKTT